MSPIGTHVKVLWWAATAAVSITMGARVSPVAAAHASGGVRLHIFGCPSASRAPVHVTLRETPSGGDMSITAKATAASRDLRIDLPPGHHYLFITNANCGSFLGIQVFPREYADRSVYLYPAGNSLPLDAYDVSIAGHLPDAGLTGITLRSARNSLVRIPEIVDGKTYDVEFVRPGSYDVIVIYSDGRERMLFTITIGFKLPDHQIRSILRQELV